MVSFKENGSHFLPKATHLMQYKRYLFRKGRHYPSMPLEQMNTLFQMLELQMLEFSVTRNTQKERMKKEKLLYKSSLFH